MIKAGADFRRERSLLHQRMPVQKQVVIVERRIRLLAIHEFTEQSAQFLHPVLAPREALVQDVLKRAVAIHAMRIDRKAGVLSREPSLLRREAAFVAKQVDEVGGIAAIHHAEIRRDAERQRVFTQQSVRDGMEGAGPGQAHGCRPALVQCFADDALCATCHLKRGPARECQQQDARRVHALDHELRDTMRQCVRLSGPRARNDEQRLRREWPPVKALAEAGRLALGFVEPLQVGGRRHPAMVSGGCIYIQSPAVGDRWGTV